VAHAFQLHHESSFGKKRGWMVIAAFVLLPLVRLTAEAAGADLTNDPFRYRAGVRNSVGRHRLEAKRLEAVAASLRAKTGFVELNFDADGFLILGDRTRVEGGSAAARDLIVAAVDGVRSLLLEDHSSSRQVSFAKLSAAVIYQNRRTGQQIETRAVELDFKDFGILQGSREVLAAFDVGFVLLHELGHGALNLSDTTSPEEEPGACESYVNRIRRELGLPERLNYHARRQFVASGPRLRDYRAELSFARVVNEEGKSKTKYHYLSWSVNVVGESVFSHEAASGGVKERGKATAGIQ
jgi:hypothetical protein